MAGGLSILNPTVLNGILNKWSAPESYSGQALFPREPHPFPTAKYDVIKGSRMIAKYNVPNSEANIVKPLKVGTVSFTFLYTREKKVFEPTTLHWLRQPGTLAQKNAEAAVIREMQDLNGRNERLVEFSIWQAMTGSLAIDTERVQVTVDMKFTNSHKTATAGTAWSSATADVLGNVNAWKKLIREDGLARATTVFLNQTTAERLLKITGIKDMLSNEQKGVYTNEGRIPNLYGLEWRVYDEVYHADNGTVTYYIPDDRLFMIAPRNADGSVPFNLLDGPSADDSAPEGTLGRFAKTWKEEDPSARQILVERTWFPAIKYPDLIVYADVSQ